MGQDVFTRAVAPPATEATVSSRLRVVLLVLGIPLAAIALSVLLRGKADASFHDFVRSEVARQGGAISDADLARLHLHDSCDAGTVAGVACTEAHVLVGLVWVALIAATIGLLLLGGIRWAGRRAQGDRRRLVRLFGPGVKITMASAAVLALLHAGLLVVTLFLLEALTIGRVHLYLLGGIALAALGAAWSVARAAFGAVPEVRPEVIGCPIALGSNRRLTALVDAVARRVGTAPPDNIVTGLDPTFFVTQAPVRCADTDVTGRTLFLSLPLCRAFSTDELKAVVGHELGHFKGEDTAYSERFAPVYRGAQLGLEALAGGMTGVGQAIALIPAMYVLGYFIESFAVAERGIGRERELAADRVAAETAGVAAFASSLVKVHAFAPRWQFLGEWIRESLQRREPIMNMSRYFVDHAVTANPRVGGDAFAGIGEGVAPHPIDTHPPLRVRLEAVGADVDAACLVAREKAVDPAVSLFDLPEETEERLSKVIYDRVRSAMACGLPAEAAFV